MQYMTINEMAAKAGVSRPTIEKRIRKLGLPPAFRKTIDHKATSLYPCLPELLVPSLKGGEWRSASAVRDMICKSNNMVISFLDYTGVEHKEMNGMRYWRIPTDWLSDTSKFEAAYEKWKKQNKPAQPSEQGNYEQGNWLRDADDDIRDMVLKERENRKMAGRMVSVKLRTGHRIHGTVECYNMIGIAIRRDGETLEYKMNQIDTVEAEQR